MSDKSVVGAIGPQMSGAGKAMAPILSQGGLAIITPSSTNPDITDPKFAAQYRPAGKPIYFRTVTTDAYQGPNMADFFAEVLKVKSIYILDDQGAYGIGMADAFQARITAKGVKVLGRDQLDPKNADYSAILTKIKSMSAESLYYGGVGIGGRQADQAELRDTAGHQEGAAATAWSGADLLKGAGFPACQGWYATIAAPHMVDDPKMAGVDQDVPRQVQLGARGLHHHLLRRGRDRDPGDCEGGGDRQAGDPRGGARRDAGLASSRRLQGDDQRSTPMATC